MSRPQLATPYRRRLNVLAHAYALRHEYAKRAELTAKVHAAMQAGASAEAVDAVIGELEAQALMQPRGYEKHGALQL